MPRKLTNSEIKARLILIVGITLSVTFVLSRPSPNTALVGMR